MVLSSFFEQMNFEQMTLLRSNYQVQCLFCMNCIHKVPYHQNVLLISRYNFLNFLTMFCSKNIRIFSKMELDSFQINKIKSNRSKLTQAPQHHVFLLKQKENFQSCLKKLIITCNKIVAYFLFFCC